jgi:hypothetical protein
MFKLCTNKYHSYKHNEQINNQNTDNSECFGVNFFKSNLNKRHSSLKIPHFVQGVDFFHLINHIFFNRKKST